MIALIAAMAKNRVIGKNNTLPWHLPADLAHFKRLTLGHSIIMGRKTFESIGRPLPQRRNVVISRNPAWAHKGVESVTSFEAALASLDEEKTVFVIGGAQIYELAFPFATDLFLTEIEADVEGDAFFPIWDKNEWTLIDAQCHTEKDIHFQFSHYQKSKALS